MYAWIRRGSLPAFTVAALVTALVLAPQALAMPNNEAFTACEHEVHQPVTGREPAPATVGGAMESGEVIRTAELEIRPSEHLALARGRALALSLRELGLLVALARREGRIVSREELYGTVWDAPLRRDDRSVDVYVHKLRTKLGEALPDRRFIHTHFGFGYRFEPETFTPFSQDRDGSVTG
jgi:DNA-binding response OmpR family regulator